MTLKQLLYSVLFIIVIIYSILFILKKGRIDIKYAIIWLFAFGLMLLMLILPNFLKYITELLGFRLSSNLIFAFFIAVLIFINISLTIIISGLNNKVRLLIQEMSLLKKEVEDNEKK